MDEQRRLDAVNAAHQVEEVRRRVSRTNPDGAFYVICTCHFVTNPSGKPEIVLREWADHVAYEEQKAT